MISQADNTLSDIRKQFTDIKTVEGEFNAFKNCIRIGFAHLLVIRTVICLEVFGLILCM